MIDNGTIGLLPATDGLERNQSKRVHAESFLGGFYFHPSDEDLWLGTPVKEKATWRVCFQGTSTLVPLYPEAQQRAFLRGKLGAGNSDIP